MIFRYLIALFVMFIGLNTYSQDTLVFKSGDIKQVKVLNVDENVYYKTGQSGIQKASLDDIFMIKYEDGEKFVNNAASEENKIQAKLLEEYENFYSLGIKALRSQKFILAKDYFTKAINRNHYSDSAFYKRAVSSAWYKITTYLISSITLDEEIDDINKAIELNDNDPEYYGFKLTFLGIDKGKHYGYMSEYQRYQEKIDLIDGIIDRFPYYHSFYHTRAESYYRLGELNDAMQDINRAINLDADNYDYYELRLYINNKLLKEADRKSQEAERLKSALGKDYLKAKALDPDSYQLKSFKKYEKYAY